MVKKDLKSKILVMVLVFGIMVVGCANNSTETNNNASIKFYTEGDIYVTGLGIILHYYFSNTIEGIEKAAFDIGISYLNPPIKNAPWILNPDLDINVKNAMESRGASYSGTFYIENNTKYFVVNRKYNSSWYITSYILS